MDLIQLQNIFPKTLELLQEASYEHLSSEFQFTLKKELLILTDKDQSRWFPVFLKLQGMKKNILEVAEFEYLKNSVKQVDMGDPKKENDAIKVNPSVQFAELVHNQPKLGKMSGLYCFFKKSGHFYEFQLSLHQALILDLLHQDRDFNFDELVQTASEQKLKEKLCQEDWVNIVKDMIRIGILVET